MAQAANSPPVRIAIRDKDGVAFFTAPFTKDLKPDTEDRLPCNDRGFVFSDDGALVACILDDSVHVYNANTRATVRVITRSKVDRCIFSPRNSFLVTWERKAIEGKGNLIIWDLHRTDGDSLTYSDDAPSIAQQLHQKNVADNWPCVHWTPDEVLCATLVSNEVRFYDGRNPAGGVTTKHRVENVTRVSLAPSLPAAADEYKFATFSPVKNTTPASVKLWTYKSLDRPTANKSFFKADNCKIQWNADSSAVLVQASTDHSADSYYGEDALYLMHSNGQFTCNVSFGQNKGPVNDVKFAPSGRHFTTIQGKMPAKCTLWTTDKCQAVFEYGSYPRSHVLYSPHGRFLALGGFGNLAGEIDFWDTNKKSVMGSCQDRDGPRFFGFGPDSRTFATAALRPWRTVDNGFKIFTYYGELLVNMPFDQLYQVAYQPVGNPRDVYPDRPQSPRLSDKRIKKVAVVQKTAYVPPHLRGKAGAGGSNKVAEMMKRTNAGPRRLDASSQKVTNEGTGGNAGGLTKNQIKNQKKKEREKKRKEEEEAARLAEEQRKADAKKPQEVDLNDAAAVAKRVKACNKKLKKIAAIKEKLANGEDVDDSQRDMCKNESSLTEEVAKLSKLL